MTDLSIPNAFTSGTAIVAADVNANFDAVKTMVNTTGVPKLQASVVTSASIAAGAVDYAALAESQRWDSGDLKWSARTTPSTGWLKCDGSAVSRSTYSLLFSAIGTSFGVGDGSTTFNLPDARGRTLIAPDGGAGRVSSSNALGQASGSQSHTLDTNQIPAHKHPITVSSGTTGISATTVSAGSHTHNVSGTATISGSFVGTGATSVYQGGSEATRTGSTSATATVSGSAESAGSHTHSVTITDSGHTHTASSSDTGLGQSHNNMQPYTVGNLFIKT